MKSKKLLSMVLILAMALHTLFMSSGISLAVTVYEDGTAEHPYLIDTAEELFSMLEGSDLHFQLANDLDLENIPRTPITLFSGVFDGAGYTIKNLYINRSVYGYYDGGDLAGLFGEIYEAEVRNLTMEDSEVNMDAQGRYLLAGILAGSIQHDSYIENVVVKNSKVIISSGGAGGIASECVDSFMDNCRTENLFVSGRFNTGLLCNLAFASDFNNCGTIGGEALSQSGGGGLIGSIDDVTLYDCYSIDGQVISNGGVKKYPAAVGGLVGYAYDGELFRCYSTTDVSYVNGSAGGLVGEAIISGLYQCYAKNKVEGGVYVAGLIGGRYHDDYVNSSYEIENTIKDSYSDSEIICVNPEGIGAGAVCYNIVYLVNSYFSGSIEAENKMGLGGLTDEGNYDYISNSYFNIATTGVTEPEDQARTTSEMYQQINYVDWDFDSIWTMEDGEDYPKFQYQN